jgi:hypothetical protein
MLASIFFTKILIPIIRKRYRKAFGVALYKEKLKVQMG